MGTVIMSGIVPLLKAPVKGILASTLAVGSVVKLMENGSPAEYLVVNQGVPSGSSLYDASCDGTWLLRKDVYEKRSWHSENVSDYAKSTIHQYLNNTFLKIFAPNIQEAVKQVKIPYVNGAGDRPVASGKDGLLTKVFLLSGCEIGKEGEDRLPRDGAKLTYFESGSSESANSKRVAKYNGSTSSWYLRSPYGYTTARVWSISSNGGLSWGNSAPAGGIRPGLVLPGNALFDKDTLVFVGRL